MFVEGQEIPQIKQEEEWADNRMKFATQNILTYEESKELGYTQINYSHFLRKRIWDRLNKDFSDGPQVIMGDFETVQKMIETGKAFLKNPSNYLPLEFLGGRAGSKIIDSFLEHVGKNGFWDEYQVISLSWIPKINNRKFLHDLEYYVLKSLEDDTEANTVKASKAYLPEKNERDGFNFVESDKLFFTERAEGDALYDLRNADFKYAMRMGFLGNSLGSNSDDLMRSYKQLINESIHISTKLPKILDSYKDSDLKKGILEDKYLQLHSSLELKGKNISLEQIQGSFETYKLIDSLDLDENFVNTFKPVQNFINDYTKDHSIWISDRSPKNKKSKNYDFNKIDYAPLTRELTLILDMDPCMPSSDEKVELVQYAASQWKLKTGEDIELNQDFWNSFYSEGIVRSALNAKHSFKEAKEIFDNPDIHYTYTKHYNEGLDYMNQQAKLFGKLIESETLSEKEAIDILKPIADSLKNKRDFVGYKDFLIDCNMYYMPE